MQWWGLWIYFPIFQSRHNKLKVFNTREQILDIPLIQCCSFQRQICVRIEFILLFNITFRFFRSILRTRNTAYGTRPAAANRRRRRWDGPGTHNTKLLNTKYRIPWLTYVKFRVSWMTYVKHRLLWMTYVKFRVPTMTARHYFDNSPFKRDISTYLCIPVPPGLYFEGGWLDKELRPLLTLLVDLFRLRSVSNNVSAVLLPSSESESSEFKLSLSFFFSFSLSESESSVMMSLPSGAVLKPLSFSFFFLSIGNWGVWPGLEAIKNSNNC